MINNPKSTIVIKTNENVNTFHDTFLTSCFKFFFGKVQFKNDQLKEKQQVKLQLSKSFTQTTAPSTKSIIIIDYPNIMHTLHNEYKNRSLVIQKFYHFVYHALHENNLIYIVSKHVKIGDTTYSFLFFSYDIKTDWIRCSLKSTFSAKDSSKRKKL